MESRVSMIGSILKLRVSITNSILSLNLIVWTYISLGQQPSSGLSAKWGNLQVQVIRMARHLHRRCQILWFRTSRTNLWRPQASLTSLDKAIHLHKKDRNETRTVTLAIRSLCLLGGHGVFWGLAPLSWSGCCGSDRPLDTNTALQVAQTRGLLGPLDFPFVNPQYDCVNCVWMCCWLRVTLQVKMLRWQDNHLCWITTVTWYPDDLIPWGDVTYGNLGSLGSQLWSGTSDSSGGGDITWLIGKTILQPEC